MKVSCGNHSCCFFLLQAFLFKQNKSLKAPEKLESHFHFKVLFRRKSKDLKEKKLIQRVFRVFLYLTHGMYLKKSNA